MPIVTCGEGGPSTPLILDSPGQGLLMSSTLFVETIGKFILFNSKCFDHIIISISIYELWKMIENPFGVIIIPVRYTLFTGTVPVRYTLFTGNVPVSHALFKGTVPVRSALFTGTVRYLWITSSKRYRQSQNQKLSQN